MGKVCFNKQKMGCDKVFTPEQLFAKIFHLFIQISSPSQLGVGLEWDRNQQLRQKTSLVPAGSQSSMLSAWEISLPA